MKSAWSKEKSLLIPTWSMPTKSTAYSRWRVIASSVGVFGPRKMPTPVIPTTPPVSAQARAWSSVILRGCSPNPLHARMAIHHWAFRHATHVESGTDAAMRPVGDDADLVHLSNDRLPPCCCDACVDSCVRILADPSVPFPDFRSEGDAALLARLAPAAGRAAAADTGLRGLVDTLRRRGVSWARIGQALGVTRQAAWERFN